MPPNKGGNAKKESGRAKKAENEAKKQDAAAAQKVYSHLTHIRSDVACLVYINTFDGTRNLQMHRNGMTALVRIRNRRKRRKSGKRSWHEKQRLRDYWRRRSPLYLRK